MNQERTKPRPLPLHSWHKKGRVWTALASAAILLSAGVVGTHCDSRDEAADAPTNPLEPVAGLITEFVPTKSHFAPSETVQLLATVENATSQAGVLQLDLTVTHLGQRVFQEMRTLEAAPNESLEVVIDWEPPPEDFRGYLARLSVVATAEPGSGARRSATTAIDVSSAATRFPRYGFISEFYPRASSESERIVYRLARQYHLNMLQFYDWFWRHENLLQFENGQLADSWQDLFGRNISVPVLQDLIRASDDVNTLSMAYVAAYAAREGYEQVSGVSPAGGLFQTPTAERQRAVELGGPTLFLFNPADPQWQQHEIGQFAMAIDVLGFDGVHIDQFGPIFGDSIFDVAGTPVDVPQTFPPFLQATKRALLQNDPQKATCVFNIVDGKPGGWAAEPVARSGACDFLYSELWFLTNTYDDLRVYTEYLKAASGGKPVVLAGYAQYDEDVGPVREAEEAELKQGVFGSEQYGNYTGDGYVSGFDAEGDTVAWDLSIAEARNASFKFRYANATGQTASRTVFLNGEPIGTLQFPPLGAWDEWSADPFIRTRLSAGEHRISIVFTEKDSGTIHLDHLRLSEFSAAAILLQNAAMLASGASPIQIGDDLEAIVREYFPNRSKTLPPSLVNPLREYYKFMTAYENLLFGAELVPVGTPLSEVQVVEGPPLVSTGSGGVWPVVRRSDAYDVVHLINLVGVEDDLWRNAASVPVAQTDLRIRYFAPSTEDVIGVWVASPDLERGEGRPLQFSRGETSEGQYIEFVIPRLEYWDMLFMLREAN